MNRYFKNRRMAISCGFDREQFPKSISSNTMCREILLSRVGVEIGPADGNATSDSFAFFVDCRIASEDDGLLLSRAKVEKVSTVKGDRSRGLRVLNL